MKLIGILIILLAVAVVCFAVEGKSALKSKEENEQKSNAVNEAVFLDN